MDKRSIIAIVLIFLVIIGGQLLMPRQPEPSPADSTKTKTKAPTTTPTSVVPSPSPSSAQVQAPTPTRAQALSAQAQAQPPARAETVSVSQPDRVARFSTQGAAPLSITLPQYQDLKKKSGSLAIAPNNGPLLRYRIVSGKDTTALDNLSFTATTTDRTADFASPQGVRVHYEVTPDHFITHATITAPAGGKLLIDLPEDLRSGEADTVEDLRHLAYSYRPLSGGIESFNLQRLDTTKTEVQPGPIDWAAARSKYFAFAVIAKDSTHAFTDFTVRGVHRTPLPVGTATISLPMTNGSASFDLYTGPQSWTSLRGAGHDLININPYAGWAWLRPVVQPFATIVMRLLLGLKGAVNLSYGWVLVIFGILIRLVLWPLNQSAMRTSIKMQKLQPELAALQKRYAKDPEAQRAAMMKLYQQHDMSPFSPLMGCLPMLLPMPILFALYFVFQNTIEFRGVPFLWMPDISLRDPFYITPILMGVSMFVLSWIGMRSAPPNPQAKVMGYMMPAMFMVMFMNLASGLNLYYAVQNLVAIPQQWFLTKERAKAAVVQNK